MQDHPLEKGTETSNDATAATSRPTGCKTIPSRRGLKRDQHTRSSSSRSVAMQDHPLSRRGLKRLCTARLVVLLDSALRYLSS